MNWNFFSPPGTLSTTTYSFIFTPIFVSSSVEMFVFYLSLIYIYKYVYFSLHKSRTNVSSLSRVSYRGWNVVKRYQPMYLWGGICVAEKIG